MDITRKIPNENGVNFIQPNQPDLIYRPSLSGINHFNIIFLIMMGSLIITDYLMAILHVMIPVKLSSGVVASLLSAAVCTDE
ncbi:MAG: hypothetical protein OEY89_07570 [Gammaproteobacteria bacterium]|nr:hypothetical protein [Gammaproteobacteria bacterium]